MKRILLIAALCLAGCGTTYTGPTMYRCWCTFESKFVGAWETDRAQADATRAQHNKRFPSHNTYIQIRSAN